MAHLLQRRMMVFVSLLILQAITLLALFAPLLAPHQSMKELAATADSRPAIPKILHQVFTSENLFQRYKPYIESCLNQNPDWKYYLWTEEDANLLIERHYPELKPSIERMGHRLGRSDTARYAVLHRFGGVYMDMDVECLQPLLPGIVNFTSAFVAQEPALQSRILHNMPFSALNGVMGAEAGHPFFRSIVNHLASEKDFNNVLQSTGPAMLTRKLQDYWNDPTKPNVRRPVVLTPSYVFVPSMDLTINWYEECSIILGKSNLLEKRSGCDELRRRKWILPHEMRPETIGDHHWIHLGYSVNKNHSRFNAREEFQDRVHFYRDEIADS